MRSAAAGSAHPPQRRDLRGAGRLSRYQGTSAISSSEDKNEKAPDLPDLFFFFFLVNRGCINIQRAFLPLCAVRNRLAVTEAGGTSCNRVPHPKSSISFGFEARRASAAHLQRCGTASAQAVPGPGSGSHPGSRLLVLGPVTSLEGCQGLYGVCQALSTSVFSGILLDKLRRC